MPSAETGSGATTSGGIRLQHYYPVGPAQQLGGLGWGIGQYSGTVSGEVTTTLNGALGDNAYGTGGSGTSITLTDASAFPSSGTSYIKVGTEEISYTGVNTTTWQTYNNGGFAYQQGVNLFDSTSNYFELTGVQFEIGSIATEFEHRSYGE